MREIIVVATLNTRPGKEDEAREVLSALVEPTHREPGCILYALHQGVDDPTRLMFIERWSSREALDAHQASPHNAAVGDRLDELLAAAPDVTIYDAVLLGEPAKGALATANA